MIIDIFSHHISPSVGKMMEKAKYYGEGKEFPYPPRNADPEVRLSIMEKYGVDMQAVSQTTPVLLGLSDEDAMEVCRLSNQDNYALCNAYPDKFVNVCIFHLPDMKGTMEELDRAVNELDCRGVTISSNQSGRGLDSPEFFPFFVRRIETNVRGFLQDKLPRDISEYFGNIYGDTAVDGTPGAFQCGYAFFGAERMMYGSDYPFGAEAGEDFVRENLAGVKALAIPEAEKKKILGENAKKMLKIA
jgi:predicted TIM-barrel fold metal-dependent hydrolase